MQARLRLPAIAALFVLLGAAGCIFSPDPCDPDDPKCGGQQTYLPQTSPENVMNNIELAYKNRDIDKYCAQLAYDFVFEFNPDDLDDPGVPPDGVFHFEEDSLSTRNMFKNENLPSEEARVLDVRIRLQRGDSVPDNRVGHAGWRYILVTNTFLEVDQVGGAEGTITLQVPGGQADFYFRKGRTPEETTSNLWYVAQWRDRTRATAAPGVPLANVRGGATIASGAPAGSSAPATHDLALGAMKAMFR